MRLRRRPEDAKLSWLAQLDPWSALGDDELEALGAVADRMSVPAGSPLLREGELGRECLVIAAGEVEVRHEDEPLATLGPGAVVGELSLLDHVPRNADVHATTDVELLVFDLRGFHRAMREVDTFRDLVERSAEERR